MNVKLKIFLLVITLFIGNSLSAQSTEQSINEINKIYQEIQNILPQFSKIKNDILGESTESGEATAYIDNHDITLIEVWWYGESGKRKMEYCYDNDELIFALDKIFKYNVPIYMDKTNAEKNGFTEYFDEKKTTTTEEKYYFKNEQLISWLDNDNKQIDSSVEPKNEKVQEIISDSQSIISSFEKKLDKECKVKLLDKKTEMAVDSYLNVQKKTLNLILLSQWEDKKDSILTQTNHITKSNTIYPDSLPQTIDSIIIELENGISWNLYEEPPKKPKKFFLKMTSNNEEPEVSDRIKFLQFCSRFDSSNPNPCFIEDTYKAFNSIIYQDNVVLNLVYELDIRNGKIDLIKIISEQ